jgi:hypothetical protein
MTQQFKFGDRVRHLTTDEEYIVWGMVASDPLANDYELGAVEVIGKDYFGRPKVIEFSTGCLQHLHHPDTVRLDYLLFNEYVYLIGRYGKRYGIGRDEIDAAMRIQAAEAV